MGINSQIIIDAHDEAGLKQAQEILAPALFEQVVAQARKLRDLNPPQASHIPIRLWLGIWLDEDMVPNIPTQGGPQH